MVRDRRAALAATAAALLAAGALGADLGFDTNLSGTLGVVPLIAALGVPWRWTAWIAGVAVTLSASLAAADEVGAAATLLRVGAVVATGLLAVWVAQQMARHERDIEEVRRVAEVAQLAVLTPVPASTGPYALASAYLSASKEALIGGDLYGVVESAYGLRLIIADVRGKGLDAVALAASTLQTFRELAGSTTDLAAIARKLDDRLTPLLGVEDFVTMVIACFSPDGVVDLVNCGHPPPMIIGAGGMRMLETGTPTAPIGLGPEPQTEQWRLAPGERVLFYTDGLVETKARDGGFVDLDRTLAGVGMAAMDSALAGVLRRLREQSTEEHRDDLAMLLVEYTAEAPAQATPLADGRMGRVADDTSLT